MKKRFSVTKNAKIFVAISLVIILAGIIAYFLEGFVPGIDFSGGTILTLNMGKTFTSADSPALQEIVDKYMADNAIKGDKIVSASQDNQAIIRYQANADNPDAEKAMRTAMEAEIKKTYPDLTEASRESVGPTAGREMQLNALYSVTIACVLILIYVAIRFEFVYGVAAIASLLHDVLIMAAVMIFTRTQVNSTFIAAMLTIVGYSINDTIVLFDRIRENVKKMKGLPREEIVDISFLETLVRTLNTSLTVFFTLVALYFLGVQSIKEFAMPLLVGVISGTYSSILIAAPIWIWIHNATDKRRKAKIAARKQLAKGGKKQLAK
jgi:preprotein translocase subunit SecF